MRLLRTRFRRRKNAGTGNLHIFAQRNFWNQVERGKIRPATEPVERTSNQPGETNRQFAVRMRVEATA